MVIYHIPGIIWWFCRGGFSWSCKGEGIGKTILQFIMQRILGLEICVHLLPLSLQLRLEGKDYIVQEGDVMLFRFNVWQQLNNNSSSEKFQYILEFCTREKQITGFFFLSETLTVLASLELCGIIALAHGFVNHSR